MCVTVLFSLETSCFPEETGGNIDNYVIDADEEIWTDAYVEDEATEDKNDKDEEQAVEENKNKN